MTKEELARFIKQQLSMGARIAQKANRARVGAAAFTNIKSGSGKSLGDRILAAIDRPGVAPSSRPLSAAGAQTFHFAVTTVSRTSDFAQKMKNDVAGKAGDHMSYVERDGAAEAIDPAVRRDADAIDRETWKILGGQEYIERPDAAEVLPDGRTLASFGNIAATLEERVAYWDAMEEAAVKPKSHGIVTDRTVDEAFWDRVDSDATAPSRLRSAPKWMALPVDASTPAADVLNRPVPIPRVSDKEAIEIAQYFVKHRSRERGLKKAVTIDPGRGGRIQNRIIVELPHELSAVQRLDLAKAFCQKHFVEGREAPLPHWCVIHAPDHHNDPRNTHMHIVFAERPAKRMTHPETGEEAWDFSIQIKVRDNAKHVRLQRPFEQPPDRSLKDVRWVKKIRSDYATMANEALAAAGKSKIYDARTYKEMGVDTTPNKHINRKDYTSEKKGISTRAGDTVVSLQWANEEARLAKRHDSLKPDPKVLAAFDGEFKRWDRSATSATSVKYKVMMMRHEWTIAQAHRRYHAAEAAANALVMRKIKSKLIPPLGVDSRAAADATAYLKMFKTDLVDKHLAAVERWKKCERYTLATLKQAQLADPRTAKDDEFMSGSNVLRALNGFMTVARDQAAFAPTRSVAQVRDDFIEATNVIVAENRDITAAQENVGTARKGSVEQYPNSIWERAAEWLIKNSPNAAELALPDPASLPAYDSDGEGRWKVNGGSAPTNDPPAPKARVGDEVTSTFLSDTGKPVQRRVVSPSTVAQRERMADAIIANVGKRRAEREAARIAAIAAEQRAEGAKAMREMRRMQAEDAAAAAKVAADARTPALAAVATPTPAGEGVAAPSNTAAIVAPAPVPATGRETPSAGRGGRAAGSPAPSSTRPSEPIGPDPQIAAPIEPATPVPTTSATVAARSSEAARARAQALAMIPEAGPTSPPAPDRAVAGEGDLRSLPPSGSEGHQTHAGPTARTASPAASAPTSETAPETIRLEDIEVAEPPETPRTRRRPVLTAEQLRQRALMATRGRGHER